MSGEVFLVENACAISGRGTVVFLEGNPKWLPWKPHRVSVQAPGGAPTEMEAQVEFARKVPPGEVMVLLFAGRTPEEFPPGTRIIVC